MNTGFIVVVGPLYQTGPNLNMVKEWSICLLSVSIKFSLKDDDSGDHDQDQGSPKDGEKEKTEDEDKEQNISKKKVSLQYLAETDSLCL